MKGILKMLEKPPYKKKTEVKKMPFALRKIRRIENELMKLQNFTGQQVSLFRDIQSLEENVVKHRRPICVKKGL